MKKILLSEIDKIAVELSEKITNDKFTPDEIIYIEKAGFLIAEKISQVLKISLIHPCSASRNLTKLKKNNSLLLAKLPDWLNSFLRILEVRTKLYKVNTNREIKITNKINPNSKILIIDDSIDTGHTVLSLVTFLVNHGVQRSNIKIAVINILSTKYLKPVILPEYFLFKNIHIQYPWSSDSKEYQNYLKIYEKLKIMIG